MSKPRPDMTLEYEEAVESFVDAFCKLRSQGADIQHSSQGDLLAVHLPQIRRLAKKAGIALPSPKLLNAALSASDDVVYREPFAMVSCQSGKLIDCWVFLKIG